MAAIDPNATLKVPVDQELRLYYFVQGETMETGSRKKGKKEDLSVSLNCGVLDEIANLRMTVGVL